jgi:hypothetical protein
MNWLSKWITDEWTSAWKWLNVQLAALLVAAPILYAQFSTLQEYIPHNVFRYGMSGLGLLILINTLRKKNVPPA